MSSDDAPVLGRVAEGVFDHPVRPEMALEFLADPRHHIAVALDDGTIVGFASGVHYVHPDKPPELFVNEVGVAPTHQSQGIGTQVLLCLLNHARTLGCVEAWVMTEDANAAARRMYAKAGGIEQSPMSLMIGFDLNQDPLV